MGRLINAIRRNLRRKRKRPTVCSDPDHTSLKTNVNELREQLNQLFSRQQQLTKLMSAMTEQLKETVTDAREGFKTLNNANKIADLVQEVKKDTLGEGSDYSNDGTVSEGTACSGDSEEESSCYGSSNSGGSEEELSCSGESKEELSCSSGSEEEFSCSDDSEEEISCSGGSEEELSCFGDSEEDELALSCSDGSEEELSCSDDSEEELSCCSGGSEEELSCSEEKHPEGEHKSSYLEREFSEEDSFRILTNQSSSEKSVQKIDAAEAVERERLWKEEMKAYYDRMLRERPELFYPTYYYIAPQHYFPEQASSSFSFQYQVSSQAHVSGTNNVPHCQYNCFKQQCVPDECLILSNHSGLQEHTQGEGTCAYTLVGDIQNVPQNTVIVKEDEHQLSYSSSAIDFYENPYSLQRVKERCPIEESGEHQQSMEQVDQCIHGEDEGMSDEFEEELSQSNGDLFINDNTSCREVEEEDSFRILTNQSSSKESVQKIDAAEADEREQLWKEEIKVYYDRMLRERPELFYPVYYIAPQHCSPGQASSSSFVQHQVSSQVFGTANMPSCGCYGCCNSYHRHAQQSIDQKDQYYVQGESKGLTSDHLQIIDNVSQFSFGANRDRVLDEECEHDISEVQPPVGVMTETVYPEYNMWSVQRIAE